MDEPLKPLLLEDPRAFMDIVMNHDTKARVYGLHTHDDLVTCEIIRHGIFNDASKVPELIELYDELVLPAPVERRKEIYGHVAMIVSGLGGATAGALNPFMLLDDDMAIVSTATIDYASLGDLLDDDPMTRPRNAVELVVAGAARNPAAVLGGLLALGDPRVCELVAPFRSTLDNDQVGTIARCHTGLTASCVVNFYLEWLDELIDDHQDEKGVLLGVVAAGLTRLADRKSCPFIRDGLRPFPTTTSHWPQARAIDPKDFANSIADRLYDLEARERPPKILPHAISAFGLVPRTRPDDTATLLQ